MLSKLVYAATNAVRALVTPPVTFRVRVYAENGGGQAIDFDTVEETLAYAENAQTPCVWRLNEHGQTTARWTRFDYGGVKGEWMLVSDRPGYSDVERKEVPHNNF